MEDMAGDEDLAGVLKFGLGGHDLAQNLHGKRERMKANLPRWFSAAWSTRRRHTTQGEAAAMVILRSGCKLGSSSTAGGGYGEGGGS